MINIIFGVDKKWALKLDNVIFELETISGNTAFI